MSSAFWCVFLSADPDVVRVILGPNQLKSADCSNLNNFLFDASSNAAQSARTR